MGSSGVKANRPIPMAPPTRPCPPGRPRRAVRQARGAGGWEGSAWKKSSTKAEGMWDVSHYSPKRYIFKNHLLKRTFGWISPHSKSSRPGGRRQRDPQRQSKLGRVQSNVTTRIQQLKSSWARRCSAPGRRMVLRQPANPCAVTPTARWPWPKRARRAVRPQQPVGACARAPWKARPQRAAPAAGATACPVARRGAGLVHCTLPTTGGAIRRPRSMPPWSPGHHLGWKPIRRWNAPGVSRIAAAGPARAPPTGAKPRRFATANAGRLTRGCYLPPHRRAWIQGACGHPQVLELASYHAIIACVAAGRCAGVVPQAVWDLMREPRPCAWYPCRPATRCCAPARPSRPR